MKKVLITLSLVSSVYLSGCSSELVSNGAQSNLAASYERMVDVNELLEDANNLAYDELGAYYVFDKTSVYNLSLDGKVSLKRSLLEISGRATRYTPTSDSDKYFETRFTISLDEGRLWLEESESGRLVKNELDTDLDVSGDLIEVDEISEKIDIGDATGLDLVEITSQSVDGSAQSRLDVYFKNSGFLAGHPTYYHGWFFDIDGEKGQRKQILPREYRNKVSGPQPY